MVSGMNIERPNIGRPWVKLKYGMKQLVEWSSNVNASRKGNGCCRRFGGNG